MSRRPQVFGLAEQAALHCTGKHRARFLHNMTTCQVKALAPGEGRYGLTVDHKGRVVADFVLAVQQEAIVLETSRATIEDLEAHLEDHRVADRIAFERRSGRAHVVVAAEGAAALVGELLGIPIADEPFSFVDTRWSDQPVRAWQNPVRVAGPAVELSIAAAAGPALLDALALAGAELLDAEGAERLRISRGAPRVGVDLTHEDGPLDAQVTYDTIDWDKGCYIGQEVIARTHYRGQPNRRLIGLRFRAGDALPAPGEPLMTEEGKQAGRAGSSTTLAGGEGLVLAMVMRRYVQAAVPLGAPDGPSGTPVELPLSEVS